jgi:hypothetical protein
MQFEYLAGNGKKGILTLVPSISLLNPKYLAVATVEGNSMVVSHPRPLDEAVEWAQNWCSKD